MAWQAADEAWRQAGLPDTAEDPERAVCAWGTGLGGSASLEASYQQMFTATPPRVHPYTVVRVMANSAGSHLAMRHQLRAAARDAAIAFRAANGADRCVDATEALFANVAQDAAMAP